MRAEVFYDARLVYGMEDKECPACGVPKPLSEWNKHATRGTQTYCRECTRERDRTSYGEDRNGRKAQIRANVKKNGVRIKEIIYAAKAGGCRYCPENERACLDFHHVRGEKSFNVGDAQLHKTSPGRLREEIAKCLLVCSNCHRKIHAGVLEVSLLDAA